MFTTPVLLVALLSNPAVDLPAAFDAGDVGRILRLWHDASPSLVADRRRITLLALDDVRLTVAENGLEVRDAGGTLLERYELAMQDGRVWTLLRPEPATPLAVAREQIHRGAEYLDSGELDAAHGAFTRAATLAETAGHAATRAAAQRGLGTLAITRGDSATAVQHLEQALATAKAAADRHGEGRALVQLGNVSGARGDYESALTRFRAALQIFRDGGHRLAAAHALNRIGFMYISRGEWSDAHPPLAEAAAIFEELGDIEGLAGALNSLGLRERNRGSYAEGAALLRRSLELHRIAGSRFGTAVSQGNLAVALAMQGHYAEAVIAFRESLEMHERLGRFHSVMLSLGNTGEMYRLLGDYEQAREYFERSLAMAEKADAKRSIAIALHNLAQLRLDDDDPRGAIELYRKSMAIDEEIGDRGAVVRTLHNIGRALRLAGDRAAARASFERSLALARKLEDADSIVLALGMVADLTEDPAQSIELARQALDATKAFAAPEILFSSHIALGRAYRRARRLDEAQAEFERAVAIAEELRRSVPGEEIDQQQAFANLVRPYQEMVGVLVDQGDVAGALEYAERAKARVLLDVLRNGRPDLASVLTAEERVREAELAVQLAGVNREYRGALVGGHVAPELLAKARKARLEYESFLDVVFAAHPQLRRERGEIPPARTSDAGALLATGAADAILEFVVTEDTTYLFAITTSGGLRVHTIPIGRVELKAEVQRFRELLASHDLTYGAAARALYGQLLAPAAAQLRGKRTLCIVPDGPLWELPFQTLQPSAAEFLLDRHAVYFAPSLTVLRETMRNPARRGGDAQLIAFGNPVMPQETPGRATRVRRDASLAPLPHSETEIRKIAALYGSRNSRVHLRGAAREEVVKAEAGRYDVLHFATHGVLDDRNALYSRLVFSPSASMNEDGLLEAREIMRLDLRARLAVLSACETARGHVGAGEGLIGMSWALFVAGVPTTVVSQWSVDSASTAGLMIEFHRNLRVSGRSTAEALRQAALATRAKPAYRHPFYWAPFVVVGSAR